MIKLLNAFEKNPTLEIATKIHRYEIKHPMASASFTREQINILKRADRVYNNANCPRMGSPSISLTGM